MPTPVGCSFMCQKYLGSNITESLTAGYYTPIRQETNTLMCSPVCFPTGDIPVYSHLDRPAAPQRTTRAHLKGSGCLILQQCATVLCSWAGRVMESKALFWFCCSRVWCKALWCFPIFNVLKGGKILPWSDFLTVPSLCHGCTFISTQTHYYFFSVSA